VKLFVVRHGSAGDRSKWQGDDRARPLDARGRRQAEALPSLLDPFPLVRLLSSPYVRCVQTLDSLAAARGLTVEARDELAEGAGLEAFRALVLGLGEGGNVLCVHGDLLEELVGRAEPRQKGSVWIVDRTGGELRPETYLPPGA
jgi:phosphohistidine phosphatase SixA